MKNVDKEREKMIHGITRFQHDAVLLTLQNAKRPSGWALPPIITLIGPGDQVADVSKQMTWNSEREKYHRMSALSIVCQTVQAQGVVLSSDTRLVDMQHFVRHFQIDVPIPFTAEDDWKLVSERYLRILNDDYGGLVKNLPRELWCDSIMTICKGPRIRCLQYQTSYEVAADGVLKLVETNTSDDGDLEMLHSWWDD